MTKQILMTSPANFSIQYEINPWMTDNMGKTDNVKAAQQWAELRNLLIHAGQYSKVDIIVLPRTPEYCPDAVFTSNAGLVYKNTFVPSFFRHEERMAEEPFFTNWFIEHKYDVVDIKTNKFSAFEGTGDAIFNADKTILWFGFGFRSFFNVKRELDNLFDSSDVIVRPLELVDPRFFHLSTCFCPTDTGHLIWYPPAFSEHSQYILHSWYGDKSIEVTEEDALKMACSSISVGNSLIMPLISKQLEQQLLKIGFAVGTTDMSEFIKAGGGPKCLTLEIIE